MTKEGYLIRDQSKAHFIAATVVDWVDVITSFFKIVKKQSLGNCQEIKTQ